MKNKYIFQSTRLGFRTWQDSDLPNLSAINTDPEVMKYFPNIPSSKDTWGFIQRMQQQYAENGFCYYAVELLDSGEFIGFIGIARQDYEAHFTPCIDIGWRLGTKHWGNGYAQEGAKAVIYYAFETIGLSELVSVAPLVNLPSLNVMAKSGMSKTDEFKHPLLKDSPDLEKCALYSVKRSL